MEGSSALPSGRSLVVVPPLVIWDSPVAHFSCGNAVDAKIFQMYLSHKPTDATVQSRADISIQSSNILINALGFKMLCTHWVPHSWTMQQNHTFECDLVDIVAELCTSIYDYWWHLSLPPWYWIEKRLGSDVKVFWDAKELCTRITCKLLSRNISALTA